jgi:hypothetical protein
MTFATQTKQFATNPRISSLAGLVVVGVLAVGTGFASNRTTLGRHAINTASTYTKTNVTAAVGQRRGRNGDGYPNLGGSYDLRQTALNAGYNEGSKQGRKDRDDHKYRNYSDFKQYRDADQDYSSKLGDRNLYQRYYRMAFESGYDTENPSSDRQPRDRDQDRGNERGRDQEHRGRNWDRYGAYGGSNELRQTALNAGYNAGIKEGRNDRKKNRHRNYDEFGSYQKATDDYSSKLGDRELYRRYYREGFANGYEDGYRGN